MDVVETSLRLASRTLPFLGRYVGDLIGQRRVLSQAQQAFEPRADLATVVASLTSAQAARLERFLDSPQFAHLVVQAMFCAVGRHDDDFKKSIRGQLYESLRHSGAFAPDGLLEATDAFETLIHSSAHAVRASASLEVLKDKTSIALAGRVAASAARNSELLGRVGALSRFEQFGAKLRTSVLAVHGRLRLPTMVRSQTATYASLYVPPRLVDLRGDEVSAGSELSGVLDRRVGTVLLGDPGAGKSTLAGKLAADLAGDAVDGWAGQVPIVLAVREHTASLRSEHQTLLHYLEATCRRPYGLAPPPYAMEYLLLNGLATVIIDGVDELGDSHFRVSFAQMVDAFASQYPLTPIVVTSRIIGYDEAPLDEQLFTTCRLAPFNDAQVAQYTTSWFALNAGPGHRRDPDLGAAFLRESAESRDLRANPLMLSLLCALYSSEGYIPRNRPAVYERCAELLFDTWDRSRGIEVPHHFRFFVRPAVQQLAWRIFTDPSGRQAVPRSEVERFLADEVLARRYPDAEDANQAAHEFLTFCAGRAWVLTDLGSDQTEPHYGFVHRTFLEYFAAAQLVKQKPEASAVWSVLSDQVGKASWAIVAQMSVQILDRDCQDGATQLLELALGEAARAPRRTSYGRQLELLRFCMQCLTSVAPDNVVIRRLADVCLTRARVSQRTRRGLHRSAVAERLADRDAPLTWLLQIQASDNSARLGRAIGESIQAMCSNESFADAAGLIAAMLLRKARDAPGPAVVNLAQTLKPLPAPARTWTRVLSNPSAGDLSVHGFQSLYKWTFACGSEHRPLAFDLLHAGFVKPLTGEDAIRYLAVLDRLHDRIFHVPVTFDFLTHPHDWSTVIEALSIKRLASIPSPRARATTVALMLPLLQPELPRLPDVDCIQLVSARWHRQPQRVERLLQQLQLAPDGDRLLREWLTTPLPRRHLRTAEQPAP